MHKNALYFQGWTCLEELIILPHRGDSGSMVYTQRDIRSMPDDELAENIRYAYDRWTWDTGSDLDKKTLELLEEEQKLRSESGFKVEKVKTSQGVSTVVRVPIKS